MAISCEILIHKPSSGKYRPGQSVTGVIKYTIEEPIEIKEIILSFTGKGRCSWTENKKRGDETKRVHYTGTEEYMSYFLSLLDKKDRENDILYTGTYEREFNFTLPTNIPSTFKDDTCNITYRLKLKFIRPGLFKSNKRFYAEVPVHSNLVMNENDGPIVFGLKKTLLKPLSAKKHIINLRAEIDKSFISPGDEVKLLYVITNDTNVSIKSINTEVTCTVTYTANCGNRKVCQLVIKECVEKSPSVPKEAVANLSSVIRTLAGMYSIQNSKIISREYKVRVTVRLPVPYVNASVEMPISIGIKENAKTIEVGDPPPSYWEAMCEEEKGKDD